MRAGPQPRRGARARTMPRVRVRLLRAPSAGAGVATIGPLQTAVAGLSIHRHAARGGEGALRARERARTHARARARARGAPTSAQARLARLTHAPPFKTRAARGEWCAPLPPPLEALHACRCRSRRPWPLQRPAATPSGRRQIRPPASPPDPPVNRPGPRPWQRPLAGRGPSGLRPGRAPNRLTLTDDAPTPTHQEDSRLTPLATRQHRSRDEHTRPPSVGRSVGLRCDPRTQRGHAAGERPAGAD